MDSKERRIPSREIIALAGILALALAVRLIKISQLVKKVSNERSAAFAAVIYALAPLSIFASRSFISDMASLGFSIAALYLFSESLDRSNDRRLLLGAALATALAILIKGRKGWHAFDDSDWGAPPGQRGSDHGAGEIEETRRDASGVHPVHSLVAGLLQRVWELSRFALSPLVSDSRLRNF